MKVNNYGTVCDTTGFVAGAVACGVKQSGNLDVTILASEGEATAAAVFTQSMVVAAPVIASRDMMPKSCDRLRAVVVNAGNANACTGDEGLANAREMQRLTAVSLNCDPDQVFVMSTGVIGVQLPMDKIEKGISEAGQNLSADNGMLTTQAIMTTDLAPKHLSIEVELPGGTVTIGGMCKGSGMIHPNMATMLGILTTDADVSAEMLDSVLQTATNLSFNRITVDGDTSTNDTVLLMANGASGVAIDEASLGLFQEAVTAVCTQLAQKIVRDGEGASKFVEIRVSGTESDEDAHQIANTIATSPLVKTAFAGSDPNWGRIMMAAGRSGVTFNQHDCALWIGNGLQLLKDGTPTGFDMDAATAVFAETDITLHLSTGSGSGEATVWTCDLTHGYITINADYTT